MKYLIFIVLATIIGLGFLMTQGCATGELMKTPEGRKMLMDSPEIQEILAEKGSQNKIDKWCNLDPALRFMVRLELTNQGINIPIISDKDICIGR